MAPRSLGDQILDALGCSNGPLSVAALAETLGRGRTAVARAARRLWAAGLISPETPPPVAGRYPTPLWSLGGSVPWRPGDTHMRALRCLPGPFDDAPCMHEAVAKAIGVHRHHAKDLLYDLRAAGLVETSALEDHTDLRRTRATWRRTPAGNKASGLARRA